MLSFLFDKTTIGIFPFITTTFFGIVICEVDDSSMTLKTLASDTNSKQ